MQILLIISLLIRCVFIGMFGDGGRSDLAGREIEMTGDHVHEIAKSKDGRIRVLSEYFPDGPCVYYLEEQTTKTMLWKSYWARGEALFSDDQKYLALSDQGRFDVIGPVLIFRIEDGNISLVYQSPGNAKSEEYRFEYELNGFRGHQLDIKVFQKVFHENSSRGKEGTGFVYSVNCDNLDPIVPTFFDSGDAEFYYNING